MNAIRTLARRIRMLVARSVVQLVDDSLKVQGLQLTLLAGEVAHVQHFQHYGFTSVPLEGCEAVAVAAAGVRSHLIAIATADGRHRKKDMQPGEVALYTDEGDYIILKRGNIIEVKAGSQLKVTAPKVDVSASSKVTLDTPQVHTTGKITAEGKIEAQGNITSQGDVKAGGISLKNHTHTSAEPGDPTSPPL